VQKWEYKLIFRVRGWQARQKDQYFHWAGDWDGWWEDDKQLPLPSDMQKKLRELGEQGWELVSVEPLAGILGGISTIYGFTANLVGGGKTEGYSLDFSGFTNAERWVFKRPKL